MHLITTEKLTTTASSDDGAIRLERNPPGCMWGLLHVLKYNRWRYAKKRLLHKPLHHIINHYSPHPVSGNGGGFDVKHKTIEDSDPVHRVESCDEISKDDDEQMKNNPSEGSDTFAPVIVPRIKDRNNNWVAIKRFKSIGHKIKHLMVFDKRDKRRIAMDGVLDKIPKDQGISDKVKNEVIQKWKNCAIKNANQQHNRLKRAPSLNESMHKYRKLFRSFTNRETKHDDNGDIDGLKLRRQKTSLHDESTKRSLGRILSLPNFSSYSLQGEDSLHSKRRNRARSADGKNCAELNLGLRFQQMLDTYIESEIKDEREIKDEKSKDNELVGTMDSEKEQERFDSTEDEIVVNPSVISSPVNEELGMDGEEEMIDKSEGLSIPKDTEFESATFEIDSLDSKLTTEPEDSGHPETLRSRVGDSIQVKPRDLELFNYVRDVLEQSGFGVWPSREQTLDPSMFDEVEGRNLLKNPKCGSQVHIFDLINEVLIDIHQRSVTYWPRPLTSHCHVRPMPSGHHVLEEVWGTISSYLRLKPDNDPTLDYIISKELEKRDGWMNLQFEGECAGLELEESVFEDLLDELMFDDLLE